MSPTPRLLVVDDEPVVTRSCTRILEGQGFTVEAANDSRTALDLTARSEYAAILLDLMIPGVDGLQFLAEFRKQGRPTPVIVITGYPTVESAAAAMRLGAVDYVSKPFTPAEIISAVTRMVRGAATSKVAAVTPLPAPTPPPAPGPSSAAGPALRSVPERRVAIGQAGTVAFTPPAGSAATPAPTGKPSRWIRRVRITNRNGQQVTLVADQGLLEERGGVGQQLIQGILQDAYPLLIGLGNEPLTAARVSAEADSDRILVLCAENLGHQPGTAVRDRPVEAVQQAGAAAQKVTTITVQAPPTPAQGLSYGTGLDAALASYLVREMTT
jgi:CheY-like chemotaxis protein